MNSEPSGGPLSPSATRQLLLSLGHRPQKLLGQNFLVDGNIVRKSIAMAAIRADDHVVEIGPGLGTLTRALLDAGAIVHAVEFDQRLAAHLRSSLCAQFPERLHLLEADAVAHPMAGFASAGRDFKVVANLPYAITSPWLDALLAGPLPSTMVLMLQKEAADRLTATVGTAAFSAITVFLSATHRKLARHPVAKSCFYPVPKVDSTLLALERLPNPQPFHPETRSLLRQLFTQRRKQIAAAARRFPILASAIDDLTLRPDAVPFDAYRKLDTLIAAAATNV